MIYNEIKCSLPHLKQKVVYKPYLNQVIWQHEYKENVVVQQKVNNPLIIWLLKMFLAVILINSQHFIAQKTSVYLFIFARVNN